jgi:hypothetical protein
LARDEDSRKANLLSYLGEQPDVSMKDSSTDDTKKEAYLPEIEIYLNLLVMIYLLDNSKFEQVCGEIGKTCNFGKLAL